MRNLDMRRPTPQETMCTACWQEHGQEERPCRNTCGCHDGFAATLSARPRVRVCLTLETGIPADTPAEASITPGTMLDIENGWLGTVGKVVDITFLPQKETV